MKKIFNKKNIKNFLLINLGIFVFSLACSFFLDINDLVVGGAYGVALLTREIVFDIYGFEISTSVFYFVYNMILLLIALIFIGKKFFIGTLYASLISPVYTWILELIYKYILTPFMKIPTIPDILNSIEGISEEYQEILGAGAYLLVIVFSAVIAGIGLGIALKYGASTGGTDILQVILLKKWKIPYSVGLLLTDGIIVLTACFYKGSFYSLLYGVLYIIISGYVLDSIVFSGFNVRAVHIVTTKPVQIKNAIYKNIARGVTEMSSKGGYKEKNQATLVCVMSNSEFFKMKPIIQSIDESSFIYAVRATEVHGEGFSYESMSETNLVEE